MQRSPKSEVAGSIMFLKRCSMCMHTHMKMHTHTWTCTWILIVMWASVSMPVLVPAVSGLQSHLINIHTRTHTHKHSHKHSHSHSHSHLQPRSVNGNANLPLLSASNALNSAHHTNDDDSPTTTTTTTTWTIAVDAALEQRYACTRFQRFDGILNSTSVPSPSNETVVHLAVQALDVARRAPSGFNAQPYKMVVVSSREHKMAVARHCSGKNAHRVRDSDCTVLFLADRETGKQFGAYQRLLEAKNAAWKEKRWAMMKLKCILALFSSGYPLLPRLLAVPISCFVRLGVALANLLIGRWIVVPTLSSAETWASKNTMLVAMAYMIGCTARGIATCPMEGIHGGGIRRALKIPRRYSIPLIVATGNAYPPKPTDSTSSTTTTTAAHDDVGMDHGRPGTRAATPRYARDEMIFGNVFGTAIP